MAAWFGGSKEGNRDVAIWLSRREDGRRTGPVKVAYGTQPGGDRQAA